MSITIENPTAETIYAALREVPAHEIERLKVLLNSEPEETAKTEETAWHQVSHAAATRFFEEEENQ